jgi:hypothetical protein
MQASFDGQYIEKDDTCFSTKPMEDIKTMGSVDISRLHGEFRISDRNPEHRALDGPRSDRGTFSWLEVDGHGDRIAIPKDSADRALLMFRHLISTETFVLGIQGFWHDRMPSIALWNPTDHGFPWGYGHARMSDCIHHQRLPTRMFEGDRPFTQLGPERFVMAELRKKMRDGQPIFVVELSTRAPDTNQFLEVNGTTDK